MYLNDVDLTKEELSYIRTLLTKGESINMKVQYFWCVKIFFSNILIWLRENNRLWTIRRLHKRRSDDCHLMWFRSCLTVDDQSSDLLTHSLIDSIERAMHRFNEFLYDNVDHTLLYDKRYFLIVGVYIQNEIDHSHSRCMELMRLDDLINDWKKDEKVNVQVIYCVNTFEIFYVFNLVMRKYCKT